MPAGSPDAQPTAVPTAVGSGAPASRTEGHRFRVVDEQAPLGQQAAPSEVMIDLALDGALDVARAWAAHTGHQTSVRDARGRYVTTVVP